MRSMPIGLPRVFFLTGTPLIYDRFQRVASSVIRLDDSRPATNEAIAGLLDCLAGGKSIFAGCDSVAAIAPASPEQRPDGQRLYCQSSGTSDLAKTIRRTPSSWIASFEINRDRYRLGAGDGYGVLGALSHSLSLYGVLEALHVGADLCILSGLSPKKQLSALRERQISVLYATPSQLRLLLEGAKADMRPLPHLRVLFSGGGKLDTLCRAGMQDLCANAQIFEFYGASETSFIAISDAQTPQGSVGQAYPGVELQIRDANGLATDEIGEIWVKSPYLFEGYETGDSADTRWQEGYLTVGEMGLVDGDGNLFLKGRKSRMITVADQNVFLEDVEAVLQSDVDVRLSAALARPDRQRGHVVVAIVEAEEHAHLTARLLAACRTSLGALAAPKQILFVDTMPLLPAGKPDLLALARLLGERA